MVHKTLIKVAETGTEAAAATGIKGIVKSIKIPAITVKFNRPFLFSILSKDTQSIIFFGKVTNPNET